MEEKEVLKVFYDMFEKALPVLKNAKEGFDMEKSSVLKEETKKFGEIIKSTLPFFDAITKKAEKNEVEKKAIDLLISAQMVAAGIQNLFQKMTVKIDSDVLFSEKAKKEIEELMEEVTYALRDLKDFILTKNPVLKREVEERVEQTIKKANDFDTAHQRRLITGVCMPKASYLYLDMTDSIRKVLREMRNLAEKV